MLLHFIYTSFKCILAYRIDYVDVDTGTTTPNCVQVVEQSLARSVVNAVEAPILGVSLGDVCGSDAKGGRDTTCSHRALHLYILNLIFLYV
jgi:hypothetical protein